MRSITGHELEKLKEGLHNLVAVVLIIEAIVFLIAYFREHLLPGALLMWVNAHIVLLLLAALAINLVFLVILFFQLRSSRNILAKTSEDLRQTSKERQDFATFINTYQVCQQGFRILAHKNAQCDKDIFDLLRRALSNRPTGRMVIDQTRTRIKTNVIEILDSTANIFKAFTGDSCAVCVKLMTMANGPDREDGIVEIVAQDSASLADRASWIASSRVRDSTEDVEIFANDQEFFIEDDLPSRTARKEYVSAARNWHTHYKAMAVTRITPLDRFSDARVILASLCVDNTKGGFDNPHCRHFIRELAWRMSIMLYELYWAEYEYRRLTAQSATAVEK